MADATQVDQDTRRQVVEGVAQTVDQHYVFADKAKQMAEDLTARLAAGGYDELGTAEALCERLTRDLQAISHDKHIKVRYNEEPRAVGFKTEYTAEDWATWLAEARAENYGFYKAERLPGNVGLLDLRSFWEAELEGAGETAVGAMSMLAHTDALIVDLRKNNGGAPSMVALLTSFLVGAEPVHLNSFYDRSGDKLSQWWTLPFIPGKRTPDKPVFVLTAKRTFSGAEEFTYNLKNLKRATIIGETTGGGAHPGVDVSVTPHFRVFVPNGRAINPLTNTNWEGTGVAPDIEVPADQAYDRAYALALEAVLKKLGDNPTGSAKVLAEEARAALEQQNAGDRAAAE